MASAYTTIDNLQTEARRRWDKLTDEDFDSIKNSAAELATRLQARYGISASDARKQVGELVDGLSDKADDACEYASDRLDRTAHRVDRIVRGNAWPSVGSALLLGAAIGFLIGQEPRRRHRW